MKTGYRIERENNFFVVYKAAVRHDNDVCDKKVVWRKHFESGKTLLEVINVLGNVYLVAMGECLPMYFVKR